ncbi:MAG: hypothetical protein N3G19_02220 [Candidatus Pacearchaeota archaeon]|nr:hypothetical protein [Candidatus Pacearchaeota archaeon]
MFREELNGWIYISKLVNKGKSKTGVNLYNRMFETKLICLDIGTKEKNFYPYTALPSEVCQRLRELYEFYSNNKKAA